MLQDLHGVRATKVHPKAWTTKPHVMVRQAELVVRQASRDSRIMDYWEMLSWLLNLMTQMALIADLPSLSLMLLEGLCRKGPAAPTASLCLHL